MQDYKQATAGSRRCLITGPCIFNKMTKQLQNQENNKIVEMLGNLFQQEGINAILYIPTLGTVSFFNNSVSRLLVLEQAKAELLMDDILRQNKAESWIRDKYFLQYQGQKQTTPSYIN